VHAQIGLVLSYSYLRAPTVLSFEAAKLGKVKIAMTPTPKTNASARCEQWDRVEKLKHETYSASKIC
jgi:hypothetical protein